MEGIGVIITPYPERTKIEIHQTSIQEPCNQEESGMKYIGSLINTVNTRFNYQFYTDKNIDFSYKYSVCFSPSSVKV